MNHIVDKRLVMYKFELESDSKNGLKIGNLGVKLEFFVASSQTG